MLRAVTGPNPARRTVSPRPTRKARDESDRINVSGGDHVELRRDIGRLSFPDLSPCRDPAQRYATEALPKFAIPVAGRHRVEERPPRARAHSNVFAYFEGRGRGGAEQVLSAFGWVGARVWGPHGVGSKHVPIRDAMGCDVIWWVVGCPFEPNPRHGRRISHCCSSSLLARVLFFLLSSFLLFQT